MVREATEGRQLSLVQIGDAKKGAEEVGETPCIGVASRMSRLELLSERPRSFVVVNIGTPQ